MSNLLLFLLTFCLLGAQPADSQDLRIEIFLIAHQQPDTTRVAVRLTNMSSHELDIPTDNVSAKEVPHSQFRGLYYPHTIFSCAPIPGSISLRFSFTPQNPERSAACGGEDAIPLTGRTPDILQRAKLWTRLQPRESTTRQMEVDRILPIQAGSFNRVRALYRSPQFSATDEKKLVQARITVPSGEYLSTNSFSFTTNGQSIIVTDHEAPPAKPDQQHPKISAQYASL